MDWLVLNITGTEWIIVVFVGLVLILGTGKLPAMARKMGRAMSEFDNAKNSIINDIPGRTIKSHGPVESESQKLEAMAKSVGIDPGPMSAEELKKAIKDRIEGGA